ncbi:DNA recombination protein RmuC [Schumannella soli]|uniref:DNA recombination protein RmuC n=1 Tax=Schumannella soli TaxID=2590779 RepID=A0A506Y2Z5_9MICO|nr:DNA recombination protein RmuC [Schumannella soli]TPW75797.1 DNA recombination protein RmuC [Schumannella soli]
MELLLVALLIVNLAISAIALVVALRSRATSGPAVAADTQQNAEVRRDLAEQRQELMGLLRQDRDERGQAHRELQRDLAEQAKQARDAAALLTESVGQQMTALRQESESKLEKVRETVDEKLRTTLTTSLKENADKVEALTAANTTKHDELQTLLRGQMEKLQTSNEAKLEKMRETVDEKLQGTLEKRLGESFALVSKRLEEVQKGLGEMQNLASDVGGLKRVLTNVKNRGGWGEVQLSRQLEDILTPDQYDENVAVRPGSSERVEFAVKLPGKDENGTVIYLPIDSKFPQEDYERLLDAQELGEKSAIDDAAKRLERAILEQAKTIQSKYIDPPNTTDFAILYLPTEGLFAEVVRRAGLASRLQSEHRILITGPTTLMSLLNSLQMGFRTLAIEKRSSEVWQILAAAKAEFQKYGQVWSKLEKQLQTAQNTVQEAGRRTRAVERKLRVVESLPLESGMSGLDELVDSPAVEADPVAERDAALDGLGHDAIDPLLAGLDALSGDDDGAGRQSA